MKGRAPAYLKRQAREIFVGAHLHSHEESEVPLALLQNQMPLGPARETHLPQRWFHLRLHEPPSRWRPVYLQLVPWLGRAFTDDQLDGEEFAGSALFGDAGEECVFSNAIS